MTPFLPISVFSRASFTLRFQYLLFQKKEIVPETDTIQIQAYEGGHLKLESYTGC